ncbi:hypothetical protein HCN44_009338 [Aphidius gifuensis]|uniref:RRM domain-containing protein n=1 Tax=Aphidius gifuensis TaxID=684658 RepID=A0A835CYS0_APHGI|nr:F-box/LRR-repeat protein 12-like [Aphidius gifuensis]KAF7997940.1 hypothetical protein HCN44_009338 [Aphidius gifuensis]
MAASHQDLASNPPAQETRDYVGEILGLESWSPGSCDDYYKIVTTTEDGTLIRKLFVGNLAERTTTKDLIKLFNQYGDVESCYIKRNYGRSNFAFVIFKDVTGAWNAREAAEAHQVRMHCRILRVSAADSWHQPDYIENQRGLYGNKDNNNQNTTTTIVEARADVESPIRLLNDDCLIQMFLHLPISDRVRMERVCKRWHALSRESWWSVKRLDLEKKNWGLSDRFRLQYIDTATLRKVLMRCGDFLTKLDLSDLLHSLGSSTLTIVGKLCPNLQYIDVTGIILSPSGINSLIVNCRNITEFYMKKLSGPCEKDLAKLFMLNKKLKYVSLGNHSITGKSLGHLPHDTIEKIKLDHCTSLLSNYFDSAIQKFTTIQTLELNNCVCLNVSSIAAISNMITLINLSFTGNYPLITAKSLCLLSKLTNLEQLDFNQNILVNDGNITIITMTCKKLKVLNISGCVAVTNRGILSISTLPKLETLTMNSVKKVTDESIASLCKLKVLKCRSKLTDLNIIN